MPKESGFGGIRGGAAQIRESDARHLPENPGIIPEIPDNPDSKAVKDESFPQSKRGPVFRQGLLFLFPLTAPHFLTLESTIPITYPTTKKDTQARPWAEKGRPAMKASMPPRERPAVWIPS